MSKVYQPSTRQCQCLSILLTNCIDLSPKIPKPKVHFYVAMLLDYIDYTMMSWDVPSICPLVYHCLYHVKRLNVSSNSFYCLGYYVMWQNWNTNSRNKTIVTSEGQQFAVWRIQITNIFLNTSGISRSNAMVTGNGWQNIKNEKNFNGSGVKPASAVSFWRQCC